MRIYVDLDQTLANPIISPSGDVVRIEPRPGAAWFLRNLKRHGEPWLLTMGSRAHAERSLDVLGPSVKGALQGVIAYEDIAPIEEQIQVAVSSPGLTDDDRLALWRSISPIAPKGVVFDDFSADSAMFVVKSTAVGIGAEWWIQVEPFTTRRPDRGGLRKAYAEFVSRFVGPTTPAMGRGRRAVVWR